MTTLDPAPATDEPSASASPAPRSKPKSKRKAKGAGKKKSGGKVKPKAQKLASEPRPGSKLAEIGALLARSEGCTAAEVMKATGWPSVSMPAQAKALGCKLRVVKDGKEPSRYFRA